MIANAAWVLYMAIAGGVAKEMRDDWKRGEDGRFITVAAAVAAVALAMAGLMLAFVWPGTLPS